MPIKAADIDSIFSVFAAANPHPETELEYTNHYTLLVAVVLSAQATDVGVNKATRALFAKISTPQQMVDLGEGGLKQHIKTIGMYNAKAKNVIALSEMLVRDYGGQVPDNRAALEALPGVGKKTAAVVMNCAFGQPTIAVDTHVFRVSHRLGLANGKTPDEVEKQLEKRISKAWKTHAHHWLILHGRYICKARAPQCPVCPVRAWCQYKGKMV